MVIHLGYISLSFMLFHMVQKHRLCWSTLVYWVFFTHLLQLRCSTLIILIVHMPSLIPYQSRCALHPLNQGIHLTIGTSACIWWLLALLGHLLLPRATPTQPCAYPCLAFPHLCLNMLQPRPQRHSWLFGIVWELIDPPRGVLRSNASLAHVSIQMASKG